MGLMLVAVRIVLVTRVATVPALWGGGVCPFGKVTQNSHVRSRAELSVLPRALTSNPAVRSILFNILALGQVIVGIFSRYNIASSIKIDIARGKMGNAKIVLEGTVSARVTPGHFLVRMHAAQESSMPIVALYPSTSWAVSFPMPREQSRDRRQMSKNETKTEKKR